MLHKIDKTIEKLIYMRNKSNSECHICPFFYVLFACAETHPIMLLTSYKFNSQHLSFILASLCVMS